MQRSDVTLQAARTLIALILAFAPGCNREAAAPELAERTAVASPFAGGLTQHVSVRYPERRDGRTEFIIQSRLVNQGASPATVRYRVCFLFDDDLRTTLRHGPSALPGCLAVEARETLAPGDSSAAVFYWGHALSSPGTYDVEVRQSLDPEHWTRVQVQVR